MYNGLCVAMDRIYKKSQELGGNCTPIIFVLTDGDSNTGYKFSETKDIIAGMNIPIYTISYNYAADSLSELASINEAASIVGNSEDITYANGKEYFPDIFYASSSVIADIFRACKIDLPVYAHILSYDDYMGDKSIGRAAIEKIELAWQADPNKFRVDKKKNRLIYSYPQDGPWYELKYIADELPNSLEAEISGGNQLVMNYEQAQELFGIKFRRWLGIFNL